MPGPDGRRIRIPPASIRVARRGATQEEGPARRREADGTPAAPGRRPNSTPIAPSGADRPLQSIRQVRPDRTRAERARSPGLPCRVEHGGHHSHRGSHSSSSLQLPFEWRGLISRIRRHGVASSPSSPHPDLRPLAAPAHPAQGTERMPAISRRNRTGHRDRVSRETSSKSGSPQHSAAEIKSQMRYVNRRLRIKNTCVRAILRSSYPYVSLGPRP